MWCERVLRNLGDAAPDVPIDWVDLRWDECRSVLKTRSRAGEEVRVLLPRSQRLSHGDVLLEERDRLIAVNVTACELIVARPIDPRHMALLALELGNLHWPVQVGKGEIICPEDGPALEAIEKLEIPWTRESRRFEPEPASTMRVTIARDLQVIRGGRNQGVALPSRSETSNA